MVEESKTEHPTVLNEHMDVPSDDQIGNVVLESIELVSNLQHPPDFTSSDWQDGFECTDYTIRQEESSHSESDFHVGAQYGDKVSGQPYVWHIKNSRGCVTKRSSLRWCHLSALTTIVLSIYEERKRKWVTVTSSKMTLHTLVRMLLLSNSIDNFTIKSLRI